MKNKQQYAVQKGQTRMQPSLNFISYDIIMTANINHIEGITYSR
jgi:hypothetical protein